MSNVVWGKFFTDATLGLDFNASPSTSNDSRSVGEAVVSPASAINVGRGAQRTRCMPFPTLAAGPESARLTLTNPAVGHTAACMMAARRWLRCSRSKFEGFASMSNPVPADIAHSHTRELYALRTCRGVVGELP